MTWNPKILITGAAGMLGTDLMEAFEPVFPTTGLGRQPQPNLRIPYYQCDLADPKSTLQVLERERPDFVFHTASMTNVDACETQRGEALRDNVEATRSLVEACNQTRSFLIFFSTDYVFDGSKGGEYSEEDPPHPLNFYGETKLLAEKHILSYAKQFSIFRVSWLFGVYNRCFPQMILELHSRGEELKVVWDQTGRPTYSRDVAHAFLALIRYNVGLLKKSPNQIYHLANTDVATWADYAEYFLEVFYQRKIPVGRIQSSELNRKAVRPKSNILNLEKVNQCLQIQLRPWKEAVKDYAARYQKIKGFSPV